MIKGLISLAFGALSFGILEFVVMGLLPYIAQDFDVSIADAGKTISWYALGVVAGAFFMVFCRKFNLKYLMLGIVTVHLIGTILTVFAPSFELLLYCRFISGLPHGCFFGVGAIIAQRIAEVGKSNSAMAIMVAGQTVSNVFGVPLGTALANNFAWQAIFYLMIAWGVIVLISMIIYLPDTGKLEPGSFLDQFKFLKLRAPHLIFLSIFVGNGGIFCVQTYISLVLTDLIGIALAMVPAVLIGVGFTMMVFNILSGKLADKSSPGKVTLGFLSLSVICMIFISLAGSVIPALGVIAMCIVSGVLFGVGTPQQVSIVRTAKGGELLGVALGQVAFNFGNAVGAYVGAIPLTLGLGVRAIPLVGASLVIFGVIAIYIYARFDEKRFFPKR